MKEINPDTLRESVKKDAPAISALTQIPYTICEPCRRWKAAQIYRYIVACILISFCIPSTTYADQRNGKRIFLSRCAMCHGSDIKGTGPLAHKSNPPTPDLTSPVFQRRLHDYPGVIVSSVILRPNGDLIPKTLRDNNVQLPAFAWTVNDFRDLNEYMSDVIHEAE